MQICSLYGHLFYSPPCLQTLLSLTVKVKVKVKVNVTLEQAKKGQKYSSTSSLTSVLDEDGSFAPRPVRFTPRNAPVPILFIITHQTPRISS